MRYVYCKKAFFFVFVSSEARQMFWPRGTPRSVCMLSLERKEGRKLSLGMLLVLQLMNDPLKIGRRIDFRCEDVEISGLTDYWAARALRLHVCSLL